MPNTSPPRGRWRAIPVALVALTGILLSVSVFQLLREQRDSMFHLESQRRALSHSSNLQLAIEHDLQSLESLRGLFLASEAVTRLEFNQFVDRIMDENQTVYSFVWFQQMQDGQGSERYPARYGEPFLDDPRSERYDLGADPARREALQQADATGELIVTEPLRMPMDDVCVLALAFVDSNAGKGVLAAIMPVARLVQRTLGQALSADFDLFVYDIGQDGHERLAYSRLTRQPEAAPLNTSLETMRRKAHHEQRIPIGNREWLLLFRPAAGLPSSPYFAAWITLVLGLVLTFVLTAYLRTLLSQRDRVRRQIRKRTSELEQTTRRLRDETQRRERAELRFLDAVDKINQGVALYDAEDRLSFFNSHYVEMYSSSDSGPNLGMTFAELLGSLLSTGMIDEARGREQIWLTRRLGQHQNPAGDIEIRTAAHTWRRVAEHRLPDGSTYMVVTDISQEKQREEELRLSQRMEAVGQLTGGIAHDFNNLLTVIMGNLDLLEDHLGQDRDQLALARDAGQAARHGAELTQRLLAFSRRQPLKPTVVDVNRLIAGILSLLKRALNETIELRTELTDEPWRTTVDVGQLETALLNLTVNARDAMLNGGTLTIHTDNVRLDPLTDSDLQDVIPGRYVMVSIGDTGSGMSSRVLSQAFEPFFTTKEVGKGSGLGLSMVYGFLRQSGGQVRISTCEGQGTTVKLYLPETRAESPPHESESASENHRGQGETILVVEDNQHVREMVRRTLDRLGYQVTVAADAASALTELEHMPDTALLLTDVVLPGGMSGIDLADRLTREQRNLKTVFMSGYAESTQLQDGVLNRGHTLLSKPFKGDVLARTIRRTLDQGA